MQGEGLFRKGVRSARAGQHRGHHLGCLHRQALQWLIAMVSNPEIHLGDGVGTVLFCDVDEHRDLDAPALNKGDVTYCASANGVLARKWLMKVGDVREEQGQQWSGDELGRSPSTAGLGRSVVVRFDDCDGVIKEKWRHESHDPLRFERGDIGIAPHDNVTRAHDEACPQDISLATTLSVHRVDIGDGHHPRTHRLGNVSGAIRRTVVNDDDLIEKPVHPTQCLSRTGNDGADGDCFVAARNAQRNRAAVLGRDRRVKRPVAQGEFACQGLLRYLPMFIYGVVNASPDSLNTDSIVTDAQSATRRARTLLDDGADGFDLGGQGSTDNATVVDWGEEWDRLKDVIPALTAFNVPISIDTWRPEVARRAFAAGVSVLNAANGMQSDEMWEIAREHECDVVVPFLSGPNPREMEMVREDPISVMVNFFEDRLRDADRFGMRSRCIIDPGTGFAPSNWPWEERYLYQKYVYSNLDQLRRWGLPLYIALPWKETAQHDELLDIVVRQQPEYGRAHYPAKVRAFEKRARQVG